MKQKIIDIVKNRFFIAFMAFFLWVLLFDENNLIERIQLVNQYKQLEQDKAYYLEQLEKDSRRLEELQTNNENLEKFAREEYLMKRPNEDVFVIVKE